MGITLEMPLKDSADHVPSSVQNVWLHNLFASLLKRPWGTSANGKTEQAGGQGGADRWPSLQQRGFYLSKSYEITLGKISTKQGTTSGFLNATEVVFSGLLSFLFLSPFSSIKLSFSNFAHSDLQIHLPFRSLEHVSRRTIPLYCDCCPCGPCTPVGIASANAAA